MSSDFEMTSVVSIHRATRGMTVAQKLEFWSRPDSSTGCVQWVGNKNRSGYGLIQINGKGWAAHRLAWVNARGSIPQGMYVCHTCDNRLCINPAHLFLGTAKTNSDDMIAKGRKVVVRGEQAGTAKLSESEARAILADERPHKEIAAQYGVTHSAISMIKSGRNWPHIQSEVEPPDPLAEATKVIAEMLAAEDAMTSFLLVAEPKTMGESAWACEHAKRSTRRREAATAARRWLLQNRRDGGCAVERPPQLLDGLRIEKATTP